MGQKNLVQHKIQAHFHQLSKGQQKVASFVLEQLDYVAMHSASEVGKRVGVSETTVIRFCFALGLTGYGQLQKELTAQLLQKNESTLGDYLHDKQSLLTQRRFHEQSISRDAKRLVEVAKQIDEQQFLIVAAAMHKAKSIYVIGQGSSGMAAQWLYFTLSLLRPHVKLVNNESSEILRTLQEIDNYSLVFVLSFHRYYKEPLAFAEAVKEQCQMVVGITDHILAPITQIVPNNFILQSENTSTLDAMPVLISFLNTLVAAMTAEDKDYYDKQRIKYDDFNGSFISNRWS
ncbi:MurR/RpiR family transcriptional regulator [Solibacillus sp. FSL H8-0538]|uniref:MurR/RpiR family transcriptional regulator n=1 Tax=Solibacillus sp. FSL H8-0538 TaxID=2921400 RepID=UPI0030F5AD63